MLMKKPKEIQKPCHEEAKTMQIPKENPRITHEEPRIIPKESQRGNQGETKTMWKPSENPSSRPQEGENRTGINPVPTVQQNRNNPFAPRTTRTNNLFGPLDKGNA